MSGHEFRNDTNPGRGGEVPPRQPQDQTAGHGAIRNAALGGEVLRRQPQDQAAGRRRDSCRCCEGDALKCSRRIRPQVAGEGTSPDPDRSASQYSCRIRSQGGEDPGCWGRASERDLEDPGSDLLLRPDPAAVSENGFPCDGASSLKSCFGKLLVRIRLTTGGTARSRG